MMTVTASWRYPVKSMAGERVGSTELTKTVLVGDGVVQVYDRHGRLVTTARVDDVRWSRLLARCSRSIVTRGGEGYAQRSHSPGGHVRAPGS